MSPTDPIDDPSPSTAKSDRGKSGQGNSPATNVGRSVDADLASRIMDWVHEESDFENQPVDPSPAGDSWASLSTKSEWNSSQADTQEHTQVNRVQPKRVNPQSSKSDLRNSGDELPVDEMVVYLDGQLDEEQRKSLEDKLLVDDDARRHLADLQKSWDALDALPRAHCSQSFTESTVKLVVKDAILLRSKTNRWSTAIKIAVSTTLVAASLLIGFVGMRHWATAADRQLLQDMDLIQNWEKYEAVGDLPFLKRLEQEDLFTGEIENAAQ